MECWMHATAEPGIQATPGLIHGSAEARKQPSACRGPVGTLVEVTLSPPEPGKDGSTPSTTHLTYPYLTYHLHFRKLDLQRDSYCYRTIGIYSS